MSLSVVIVQVEIFCKFHDDDTVNSNYDDKTAILLFLRALIVLLFQYLTDEIILFCSKPIVDCRGSIFMDHDNDNYRRGA